MFDYENVVDDFYKNYKGIIIDLKIINDNRIVIITVLLIYSNLEKRLFNKVDTIIIYINLRTYIINDYKDYKVVVKVDKNLYEKSDEDAIHQNDHVVIEIVTGPLVVLHKRDYFVLFLDVVGMCDDDIV